MRKLNWLFRVITKKVNELVEKDEEHCLYTLMPQKNENCFHYPKPFGGEAHENVFAFLRSSSSTFFFRHSIQVLPEHECEGCATASNSYTIIASISRSSLRSFM